MNSGFRNLLGGRDTSRFQAYLIAVAVQMLILPFFLVTGILKLNAPAFHPLAAVLGGITFGLAMNWGGGCAGGVLYKLGGGSISAFIALVMLIIGYVITENGILKPFRILIQSPGAKGGAITLQSGLPHWAWWWPIVLAALLLTYLLKRSPAESGQRWSARKTGLAAGAIGVLAWIASSLSGRAFGMAIVPGGKEAFEFLTLSVKPGWDLFFVAGIPIGAYVSASRKGEFKWSSISGSAIWRIAGGGLLLGISASIAGGCTVGHSLTGVPLLSLQSLLFTLSAISGALAGALVER